MLYANTLMTVATICHVRGRRMWFHPASALPSFAAPALTFSPKGDMEHNSPYMTKTNESQAPLLGVSSQPVNSPTRSQFRSRLSFPPNRFSRTGIAPADSSPQRQSDSAHSLARSTSTRSDVTPFQSTPSPPRPSNCHQLVPEGEPPTYSGSDPNDGPSAV
jgi:hypothetical protein